MSLGRKKNDKLTKDLQLLNKFINNKKSNIRIVEKKGHK